MRCMIHNCPNEAVDEWEMRRFVRELRPDGSWDEAIEPLYFCHDHSLQMRMNENYGVDFVRKMQ